MECRFTTGSRQRLTSPFDRPRLFSPTSQCQTILSSSAAPLLATVCTQRVSTALLPGICGHPGVQQQRCPHCRKLSEEGTGQVFMSDSVLAALMCAPRSVYSWDVLITKADGKLFFDTRTGFSIGTITARIRFTIHP